jgi:Prokaryotic lipoprotein-attachment site
MILRAFLAIAVSLSLLACGVKSDLQPQGGAMPDKREADPSKPPNPLGR